MNLVELSKTENILKYSHNKLKTFGVGSDLDTNVWRSIIRQLYSAGHLNIDIEKQI